MAKEATENSKFFDVAYGLKNILFCFLATGILLALGAVIATYLSMSDGMTELLVMIMTAACVFFGGFRAAGHAGRQGLLQGAVLGLVYMAILSLAGMLVYGEWSMSGASLISILLGVLCGAIGGMLGVNRKQKRKR
ncbi:MAG: TIGR04086 family membrane protein [Clostridia bacterium]|nr:TIGR04086 family membrane protein [Clostridia bacterium]